MNGLTGLQKVVGEWVLRTFGERCARDPKERGMRLLEEAAEFAQAVGVELPEGYAVLGRVYGRPAGDPAKELGQVGVTLLAAAEAIDVRADVCIGYEVDRIVRMPVEHFRDRHDVKAAAGISTFRREDVA